MDFTCSSNLEVYHLALLIIIIIILCVQIVKVTMLNKVICHVMEGAMT